MPSVFVYKEGFKEIESGFGTILLLLNYTDVSEECMFGYGEGAPVHIGEEAARCCGRTLVIELVCFGMVCASRMLLADWRRVLTLASLLDHPR